MEKRRFLDMDQVCDYTTLSKSYIYKKVMTKGIPFIKAGKKTIFDREQIDVWLLNGCTMVNDIPDDLKLVS